MSGFRFATEIRVRLPETDAFGVAFHGSYFTWFDVARMEYFRAIGLMDVVRSGRVATLIAHTSADYKAPARFDELLAVRARLSAIGRTSFTFEFQVDRAEDGRRTAVGKSVHVAVDPRTLDPVEVPAELREAVARFEASV